MISRSSSDFPAMTTNPAAWYGPHLVARKDWIQELSDGDIQEIEQTTRPLAESGIEIATLRQTDFPLPTVGPKLRQILHELLEGRGFVLLRGLPVERWSRRQVALAFLALGCHLGNPRSQNAQGHLLGHVKNLGLSASDPHVRLYQTQERQGYHTDSCDVVGLLCLHPARSGGLSSLVSSLTLYDEIRRRRPDLLPALLSPIETDRRGEVAPGQKPYFRIPVFNWHAGLLSAIYQRKYIDSARRLVGTPLTEQQRESLDLLDTLADDPSLHLAMQLEAGDIQLVHNHTLLHDRTAFEDYPEPERKRHLLRLWLAPPEARPLPPIFVDRFGSLIPGDRGGVSPRDGKVVVPLEASATTHPGQSGRSG